MNVSQRLISRDVLASALLAISLFAQTQAGAQTPTLTLSQAEAMTVKNHPQIAVARDVAAAAGQNVIEARSAYYPTLKGEVTASQANQLARLGAGALQPSGLFNRFGQGLQANQLVTDLGRTKNLVASSKSQEQAARADTEVTRADVILGVDRAFFAVLQAQALVTLAQETVKARQSLADQVGALAKAQLKSQIDVSFAEVNVSQARLLAIRAQDDVQQADADLSRALGQDTPATYRLMEPPTGEVLPPNDATLVRTAIENRPDLHELKFRLDAAQYFEKAERDLSRPNVTLEAVGGALPYFDQTPRVSPHDYEGVAVNLEIPIFNGHLFSARREAAHYQALAFDQRLRDLHQQIEHDVHVAWITASNALQRIPVTEEFVKQANLSLQLAQGRYNLGLASIVEISQAQLNVTQAQIENVNAKYDYQGAFAALQYTLGTVR
jgi:outer membrane protein